MTWPSNGPVEDDEDYRDRALLARIEQCSARGVVLSGVSRSGKTSLLRRLAEAWPTSFGLTVSLESGAPALLKRLAREPSSGVLVDEGQLLLRWPAGQIRRFIEALEGRRFVIAAWPSIFDPQAEPQLLRWLDGIRLECLRPFSREEATRMIRRERSRAPLGCDEAIVDALIEATGGIPVLLARLCNVLSDNGSSPIRALDDTPLEDLLVAVTSWNDPFAAILASLPRVHQEALRQLSSSPRLMHALLVEHGLARDTPPRFSGTLLSLAWGGAGPDPEPPSRRDAWKVEIAHEAPHAFRWIHLSDIHFGAGDASHDLSRRAITRAIRDDARRCAARYGAPDRIFVTGDVAQRAAASEYAVAAAWLTELAEAVGAPVSAIRVVPGNHDVDRGQAGARPVQRAHDAIRARPEELDNDLVDTAGRAALAEKLTAYRRFVAEALPEHPAACPTEIDWIERMPALPGRRGSIRVVGLSTVWVSDAFDGREKQAPAGRALSRNLVIGRAQLEHTLGDVSPEELLLVLSHHPPGWLDATSESWLASALAPYAHIHLYGHIHDAGASLVKRFGRAGASVRYVAGATHGDPEETYGYAWGAVRWSRAERAWEVGWTPRVYVREHSGVVADRNRHPELGADEFDWQRIEVGWGTLG